MSEIRSNEEILDGVYRHGVREGNAPGSRMDIPALPDDEMIIATALKLLNEREAKFRADLAATKEELEKYRTHRCYECKLRGEALYAANSEIEKLKKENEEFQGDNHFLKVEIAGHLNGSALEQCRANLSTAHLQIGQLREALQMVKANDKTVYDYNGKEALNRNGQKPGPGQRFKEPREIASEALDLFTKAGVE